MKDILTSEDGGDIDSESVNSVTYILHCFNRLQLDLNEMDHLLYSEFIFAYISLSSFLVICHQLLRFVSSKNLVFLIRLVCKNGIFLFL